MEGRERGETVHFGALVVPPCCVRLTSHVQSIAEPGKGGVPANKRDVRTEEALQILWEE